MGIIIHTHTITTGGKPVASIRPVHSMGVMIRPVRLNLEGHEDVYIGNTQKLEKKTKESTWPMANLAQLFWGPPCLV